MKTCAEVDNLIAQWKAEGLSKAEIIVKAAEACMGWPYVWGGYGQFCTTANRKSYANRGSCPPAESAVIVKKCQALNGSKSGCTGCKWYPGGKTRFFDCRGFTRWLLKQVGISLMGGGATSQWKDNSNWAVKGEKKDLPENLVACVFQQDGSKMQHTGMHVGGGKIIHCSGEVCVGDLSKKSWTHFGIPAGLYDGSVIPDVPDIPVPKPMLKKGSKGEAVKEMQTILISKGYDLGKWGAEGAFGRQTLAAVKAFQKDCGIKVDGIVGPITWEKLLKEAEKV